jgi:hypothetical protein
MAMIKITKDPAIENDFTSKYQNLWVNNNCKFAQKVTKNRIGKDKKKLQEAVKAREAHLNIKESQLNHRAHELREASKLKNKSS